ncbi:sulfolactate dehydrogenase [Rhodothalassium salexigens]|uniref:Ldh family oxidoreductase n=1 Tax=Rhodothalassium salexigens TaxID=1086 RepID=UPI0019145530|nr:Ldh family oxidoreductase [Rhodothalassium salexigens]MBK5911335.1 sulfolactate dehydrogenase [Rhodothalassium salexigens]MBK5920109.1 sulfolactate dehydrogenase [Rhodothalassium salexigens]
MPDTVRLSLDAAHALVVDALTANGTGAAQAAVTAAALVAAEADGQAGHGLSRVPSYAAQARTGKVDGRAVPCVDQPAAALVRIDAGGGFAYPAVDVAIDCLLDMVPSFGLGAAAIHRSHHFGQAGRHVERLAEAGLVALALSNTPQAMAFHGGRLPRLGTNPIAFACPATDGAPLVIDMALSVAGRGKVNAAAQAGRPIPEGWALDAQGRPTTDATAALAGSMLPVGGAKGAALALMVEVLAAALTGARFGFEASSLFEAEGAPPGLGQLILAFDAPAVSGDAFAERMAVLAETVAAEEGVRLPGTRRLTARAAAARDGLHLPGALHAEIRALAHGGAA